MVGLTFKPKHVLGIHNSATILRFHTGHNEDRSTNGIKSKKLTEWIHYSGQSIVFRRIGQRSCSLSTPY